LVKHLKKELSPLP
jgi:branched-chain amino acid aminotransferase